jgi:hypothetical protein
LPVRRAVLQTRPIRFAGQEGSAANLIGLCPKILIFDELTCPKGFVNKNRSIKKTEEKICVTGF